MPVELRIPAVGESVTEALVSRWLKKEGDAVALDEPVVELETDKVTVELPSPVAGTLQRITKGDGETVAVGDVIALIEEGEVPAAAARPPTEETPKGQRLGKAPVEPAAGPGEAPRVMPAAARLLEEHGLDASQIAATGPGGRLLKEDVERYLSSPSSASPSVSVARGERVEELVPMSPIRKLIAQRLVDAQHSAALLTTFNEIDMSAVMSLRKQYREPFLERHGIKLGFMSFFVKASVDALSSFPRINTEIVGDQILYRNYFDIGIAVSTERGLMVPVIRNAEGLGFAEIEKSIADFAGRARSGKIKLEELEGGTFTITNGGIFGSMLSTPIVNPPQSGVLGLHAIEERPVAKDGEVVIRPMMYVALTYDHRIVDGREAVTFLRRIKETIEDPSRILLEV